MRKDIAIIKDGDKKAAELKKLFQQIAALTDVEEAFIEGAVFMAHLTQAEQHQPVHAS